MAGRPIPGIAQFPSLSCAKAHAAGQDLSPHAAPYPALIAILKGEALLLLGGDWHHATKGSFAWMPPGLEHGLRAKTDVVMLLTMVKGA